MDHRKMRRILDKYWRVPDRSLTRQWDGVEDLQAYLDEQGVTNVTAATLAAKESDYDAFMAGAGDRQKDALASLIMQEKGLVAYVKCINMGTVVPGSNMSNAALKAAIKAEI